MRRVAVGVLVVVVLAAAAWLADGWARARAEDRIAAELTAELDLTGAPEVTVAGGAFLPQLWSGRLAEVTAHADVLALDRVRLTDVEAVARGARADERSAESVELTGTVAVAELRRLLTESTGLDAEVRVEGDRVVLAGELLGAALEVDLAPRVAEGRVLVDATAVRLGDLELPLTMLPGDLGDRLRDVELEVGGLPRGLTVTGLATSPAGVTLTVAGTDVALQR